MKSFPLLGVKTLKHLMESAARAMDPFFFLALWLMVLLMPVYQQFTLRLGEMTLVVDYTNIFLALGLLWLFWRRLTRRPRLLPPVLLISMAVFAFWLALCTLTAYDTRGSFKDLSTWVAHMLAFGVFIDVVNSRRRFALLAVALMLGNSYLGIVCLADYFSGVYRIGGPGSYWPTVLGCYLNFALPWALCVYLLVKNPNLRFLVILVVVMLIAALGATLSRSALIGFAVSVIILYSHVSRTRQWRFLLVLGGGLAALLLFPSFLERMLLIAPETVGKIEFSRPLFWERSLGLLDQGLRFITGIGMGHSFHLVFRNQPVSMLDARFHQLPHAHNFIIHYLIIWGLPGLLAYLWFTGCYLSSLLSSFRANRWPAGQWIQWVAVAALAGFWVEELFHVSVLYRNNMTFYWLTLAAGLAAGRLCSQPPPATAQEEAS